MKTRFRPKGLTAVLAALLALSGLGVGRATAQTITQIIGPSIEGGVGLDQPLGIAADSGGNVYVTSSLRANAVQITPGGVITEIINTVGDGAGNMLDFPRGIAVDDATGFVYVVGFSSRNAFRIPPVGEGIITEIIDELGDGSGGIRLDQPKAIAVDAAGNAYVAAGANVHKITFAGVITEILDVAGDGMGNVLIIGEGITVDATGNVYVTGRLTHNAFKITPAGVVTEIIDATGDGLGNGLSAPSGIAVDAAGNVFVAGFAVDTVFEITPAGVVTQIIGATGDSTGNSLDSPSGIAVGAMGHVYVLGTASNNAFEITLPEPSPALGLTAALTALAFLRAGAEGGWRRTRRVR